MVSEADVLERISDKLTPSHLEVKDFSDGCGAKFNIVVVSDAFIGKRVIECHRELIQRLANGEPHEIKVLAKKRKSKKKNTTPILIRTNANKLVQDSIADIMPDIHAETIQAYTEEKWEKAKQSEN